MRVAVVGGGVGGVGGAVETAVESTLRRHTESSVSSLAGPVLLLQRVLRNILRTRVRKIFGSKLVFKSLPDSSGSAWCDEGT